MGSFQYPSRVQCGLPLFALLQQQCLQGGNDCFFPQREIGPTKLQICRNSLPVGLHLLYDSIQLCWSREGSWVAKIELPCRAMGQGVQ